MKKAGKIITAIFASICIVFSVIVAISGMGGKMLQDNPELFEESMAQAQTDMTEEEKATMEAFTQISGEIDFAKMTRHGTIGAILSIIILVTILINISSMPIVMPAIATVATVVGMVLCGIGILICLVPVLIGCALVLVGNLQSS